MMAGGAPLRQSCGPQVLLAARGAPTSSTKCRFPIYDRQLGSFEAALPMPATLARGASISAKEPWQCAN